MADISFKKDTLREAVAEGCIIMKEETLKRVINNEIEKGDVLAAAKIAGIIAAKRTFELIPLCHPIPITNIDIKEEILENGIKIITRVVTKAATGAEMEALASTSIALLTIYDMCKPYEKSLTIKDIYLLSKKGGKSGEYIRKGSE